MTSNKTVTANFTQQAYTLTVSVSPEGSGLVTKSPDQTTYTYGTSVTLTANANPGWTFDHWSGDLTGNTNPDSISMTSNKTVTANFTQQAYTLTVNVSPSGGGDIKVNGTAPASYPYAYTFAEGQVVGLEAVAASGYNFANWSGDLAGSANPANITMTSDKTVTANFSQLITPSVGYYWAPEVMYFTVDFEGKITREPISTIGRLLNPLEAPSPDGIHLFEMERGTRTLDEKGKVVKLIVIRETEAPPLPDNTVVVGNAYDFEPSDITFDKPVRLTLGYNVNELPEDVASVVLAYYNSETGWIELEAESGVVAEVGKLTAPIDHFTIFAILAKVSPPPPPLPTPPPPPANFELSNLSIMPSPLSKVWEALTFLVRAGEEVTITVDVTNQGGQEGSFNAVLRLNGVTQGTKDITLGPGQSQKIVFTITENKPGSYVVQIGDLSGEFITLLWFNWWLTGGFAAAFILLCWLAWYYRIKPRKTS
jgi:uncharacterized repeat protein (TIGR02543 family)